MLTRTDGAQALAGLVATGVCVGRGRDGEGCGWSGSSQSGVCPQCGGMVMSRASIRESEQIARQWEAENATPPRKWAEGGAERDAFPRHNGPGGPTY